MFKKLGTAALVATMALLGFQASPALADPLDAASDAVIDQSTNFYFDLTSDTFDLPAGVSNANINKSWNIRGEDLVGHAGETLALVGSITKPDGTSMEITPANLMGSLSVNINLSTSAGPISTNWNSTSLVVPESTVTGGSASVNFYLGGFGMNNEREPVAPGTYTVNASIKLGANVVTSGTSWGDAWYLQSNSYSFALKGTSVTAPAGSTSGSFSGYVCVDSTKISAGEVLTAKGLVNGTAADSPNAQWEWRGFAPNSWRQSTNGMASTTVLESDLTNGLTARVSFSSPVTPGSAYASSFQILNQNNESVTGSCVPGQPAKPSIAFVNGSITVSAPLPSFADNMSSDCQLFDAAAPTVVVATKSNAYAMNGSISCAFSQGLVTGKSYFAQVRGGYKSIVDGPWSVSSDSVMKTAAGVTFTTPPSGISNAGGKLSLVSATIPSDADASNILSTSDGGNGIFTVATNSIPDMGGGTQVTGYSVRHINATGVDTGFAGTGSLTITPGEQDFMSNGRFGWYGARDKFAFVVSNFPMSGANSSPELQIFTGSWSSASVTKTTVSSSVLTDACVSALGAGYNAIQTGGMMSPPTVGASIISAATATPLLAVSCYKMSIIGGTPFSLSIPLLMTVTNSTTVNVVKALGTPSDSVNTATYSVSVNPSAGANDAAVTVMARTALQTSMSAQTTDARTIYTIKKDLTVSTSTATWTSLVSEPSIRIAANNDGTVWGILQEGTSARMFKLVGNTFTTKDVTLDANTDFAASSLTIPNGLQAGNSTLLTVLRSNSTPSGTVLAQATVDTETGAMTTYEVTKYSFTSGIGALTSTFVDSKNLYWVHTNTADATKYSIYRWRDPAYVAQVAADQTITWTTSPSSMAAGGTTTVAATASSNLPVSYSSTDATKCTVNESTGVVTAVATSGTCTIKANQAGNDSFKAAPQKLHVINIAAVVPVKKAPKAPTVATKLKIGKTLTVALHATKGTASKGANADGLPAVVTVAASSKAICSVAKVIKSKKITGYTVKGLKAGKCSVVVTITGNATFNSLTKTTAVTVAK